MFEGAAPSTSSLAYLSTSWENSAKVQGALENSCKANMHVYLSRNIYALPTRPPTSEFVIISSCVCVFVIL